MTTSIRVTLGGAPLPEGGLPREFRIFKTGWNETSKGRFLFDEAAAASVLRDYEGQGNELCIDYEHKAVDPEARAGDGKASGWFRLELRKDGLWAVDVRWTPPAQDALRNREWRYFSPAFVADSKSKRILSLINIALTNIPATKRMEPLVAASAAARKRNRRPRREEESAVMANELNENDESVDITIDDDDAETEAADDVTANARKKSAPVDDDADDDELDDDSESDLPDEDGEEEEEEDEPPRPKRKAARLSIIAAARELTGKVRASEVIGVLRAHKHAREQVTLLSERVQRLETTIHAQKVRQLVGRAVRDGKLTPALRSWALRLGTQDLTQLRAYLDQAAPIVPVGRPAVPAAEGHVVTLSADEMKVCDLVGIAPNAYAKNKALRA